MGLGCGEASSGCSVIGRFIRAMWGQQASEGAEGRVTGTSALRPRDI